MSVLFPVTVDSEFEGNQWRPHWGSGRCQTEPATPPSPASIRHSCSNVHC